jgi:hypothetical protein
MKKLLFVLVAGVTLTALSGCCAHRGWAPFGGCGLFGGSSGQCSDSPDTCQSCDDGSAAPCEGGACEGSCRGRCAAPAVNAGPPTAAVTYPYYTTRGPRDFLARNPRSIGP